LERDREKLRKWIIKKKLEGRAVTDICSEAKIDRKMFYPGGTVIKLKDGAVYKKSPKVAQAFLDRMILSNRK
jgi:hypothetical protein